MLPADRVPTRRLIDLYEQGRSLREIGREVGLPHQTVSARLARAGVRERQPRQDRTDITEAMLVAMYQDEGMSMFDIGRKLGLATAAVRARLIKLEEAGKLQIRRPPQLDDRELIRLRVVKRYPLRVISEMTGLSVSALGNRLRAAGLTRGRVRRVVERP